MGTSWVPHAVFYALNPDRFAAGMLPQPPDWDSNAFEAWDAPPAHKAYKGGNLYGLLERLDSLQDLGITALYLTPIFTSPTHHRYKTIDYYHVDPLLGGDEAFETLLRELHRRNMRIVLDGVFHHVGIGFPRFQDVLEYGLASPWRAWFHTEKWPEYRCWNNNRTMPALNFSNPRVREYILKVAEHWARKGIDGWRFDHPQGITAPGFWKEMRTRLRRITPDFYLLGEIWTDAHAWLDGTQWDGVTNYPLMSAIHRFVGGARIRPEHLLEGTPPISALDAAGFRGELEFLLRRYSWDVQVHQLNFLGTHDTARFRTLCGEDEDTVELATALLMALPGAPCIYYGDEAGLSGGVPPASRAGLPPESARNPRSMRYHRELIAMRKAHPQLCTGSLTVLHAEGPLLVFERAGEGGRILVAVNTGESPAPAAVGPVRRRLYGNSEMMNGKALIPRRSAAFWVGQG